MLYVTTRDRSHPCTTQQILLENRSTDGGFYIPFKMPSFSKEDIDLLAEKSFGQCVADILNLLFDADLSGWDIDFCIGRYPVRLEPLNSRIVIGEAWHNPDWDYARLVRNLAKLICQNNTDPGEWMKIGIRIAVLFGTYGQLLRHGIQLADIAAVSGDFSIPMSAWYARKLGLPIGNIVCICNENKSVWDLICYGQMRTDILSISTALEEADVAIPEGLERLICECGGNDEVFQYLDAYRSGRMYTADDAMFKQLQKGLHVSVVSTSRIQETISGVYRTHSYLMTSATALAYAGLMDYRSRTGETRTGIVWSEKSPIHTVGHISKALGISEYELLQKLSK